MILDALHHRGRRGRGENTRAGAARSGIARSEIATVSFLCVLCVLRGGELTSAQTSKKAGRVDKLSTIGHAQTPRPAIESAAAKDVDVEAALDRSAMWVADRVTYTVLLTCRRDVDILADDLTRDKLRLDGLELVAIDSGREDRGGGVTAYRYSFRLTTYKVDQPVQRIGEMRVRYYVKRPGQRIEDAAPAGEVVVPGATVAVRSTLPDEAQTAVFRDARSPRSRAPLLAALQPIGVGLVIVSIVPAALWVGVLVGRARTRTVRRSARQVRHEEQETLESLHAMDLGSEAGRRDAYDRVNALVRAHLRDACGVPVDGLTPAEVGPALSARNTRAPVDVVTSVLAACEQARYGSNGGGSAQACRDTIEQAQQVLASR